MKDKQLEIAAIIMVYSIAVSAVHSHNYSPVRLYNFLFEIIFTQSKVVHKNIQITEKAPFIHGF